jgi:hypothetical protein
LASLSPAGITLEEHLGGAKHEIDLFAGMSDPDEVEVVSGIHVNTCRRNR